MNIIQYVKKYKRSNFEEFDLNEVDIAIFSILAYLKYDNNFVKPVLLKDILDHVLEKKDDVYFERLYGLKSIINFIKEISKCSRYEKIIVSDYYSETSLEKEKQFGAILFHIDDYNHIVLFRGTDKSVVGWKEGLSLSYAKGIPSQKIAQGYLNRMLFKYPGNFIVAGHSKGGNLAIYAGSHTYSILRNKISYIINFDGPGFNFDLIDEKPFIKNEKKIINYYPRNSVLGMALDNYGSKVFVKTDYVGMIFTHDLKTWQVRENSFILDEQTKPSKFIQETMNIWLKKASYEDAKKIIDIIFNLIGITEGKEFSHKPVEAYNLLKDIVNNYQEISIDDKKAIVTQLTDLKKAGQKVIKDKIKKGSV